MNLLFLANENIPIKTILQLRQYGYDILAMTEIEPGATDAKVLQIAQEQRRFIITFDRDYGELIFKNKLACPAGIIYLRLLPASLQHLYQLLLFVLNPKRIQPGYFYTIDEKNIRKRPLPSWH